MQSTAQALLDAFSAGADKDRIAAALLLLQLAGDDGELDVALSSAPDDLRACLLPALQLAA
jgi:hypothetical protein